MREELAPDVAVQHEVAYDGYAEVVELVNDIGGALGIQWSGFLAGQVSMLLYSPYITFEDIGLNHLTGLQTIYCSRPEVFGPGQVIEFGSWYQSLLLLFILNLD